MIRPLKATGTKAEHGKALKVTKKSFESCMCKIYRRESLSMVLQLLKQLLKLNNSKC